MESFKIKGGKPLKGEVIPQGAKNEALQVLCAVLLTKEEIRIKNIPEIEDVKKMISILECIGVKIKKNEKGDYTFRSNGVNIEYLHKTEFKEAASSIRGSVMLLGPLLSRFEKVYIPKPGGDKIGRRRLDVHLKSFIEMGASYSKEEDYHVFKTKGKLKGIYLLLEEASITATANVIMAACLASGKTTIYNAACEPYLQQLCKMLNRMGAKISGIGSNLLFIEGVDSLGGTTHELLPDMIEVGSWIGLAAITKSEIKIKNVSYENLGIIPSIFRKLGIFFEKQDDDIYIPSRENYKIENSMEGSLITLADSPWPGLTPDLLSVLLVTAIQAKGSVLIHQKMYESRLFFVDKLIDMGAQIILCDPHRATVIGLNQECPLRGTILHSPDIRAGISLLIAALSASGESIIHNINQIDRGYENIDLKLQSLGASIERI